MSLAAGSRLGPYEIVATLGVGGMGEVYRARDTRLRRDVALKILPQEVAADPSRRLRFEQEARATAALNHPNIVAVYDVGCENDLFFIVSELVEGESLRGANPGLRRSIDWAVQIATGLAAAHAAGIVHRDLKPENILLTRDGRVKILDFGLAKIAAEPVGVGELATQTVHTEPGVVMGTVGYMSPEQVKGQPADHRSDIFSFGVILYELVGGARAFQRDTAVETMIAILKQDPPELPDSTPSGLRQIVTHCLEKDPSNRFQSARDLAFALGAVSQTASQPTIAPQAARPSVWRARARQAAAAMVLVAGGAIAARLVTSTPQRATWSGGILGGPERALDPRLSPDGHLLAFEAFERGLTQVAVMKPETGNWSILTRNRARGGANFLSWSADGGAIFYDRFSDVGQGVFSVPVLGGEERLILENAELPESLPDGSLLVVKLNAKRQRQLYRFWPDTGRLQDLPIIMPDRYETTFTVRAFDGGRKAITYGSLLGHEDDGRRLQVIDLTSGTAAPLRAAVSNIGLAGGTVSPDGASFFVAVPAGSLTQIVAIPLSGRTAERTLFTVANDVWYLDAGRDDSVYASVLDRPVEIVRRLLDGTHAEPVATFPKMTNPDVLTVLADGRVVATTAFSGKSRVVVAEPGKDPAPLVTTTDETSGPFTVVGPKHIAVMIGPAPRHVIAIADTATGRITGRIPIDKGHVVSLAASPDGRTLFVGAGGSIWSTPAAGGELKFVRAGDRVVVDPLGRHLVITAPESSKLRFYRVFLDGRREQEIVTDGSAPIMNWGYSPGALNADGRLLVPLTDAWFNYPATLDTLTGRITRLPSDEVSDYHSMEWLPDGRIMALHVGLRSTLWKFQPQ